MRFTTLATMFLFVVLTIPAFADPKDVDLFRVTKPYNAENVLMIQARANGCSVQDLDFLWLMGVDASGRPSSTKRSAIESQVRGQFPLSGTKTSNAASCAKAVPKGTQCSTFAVTAQQLSWVRNNLADPSLVIRGDSMSGSCHIGAYLDLGSRVIEIQSVNVVADHVNKGMFGISFHLDSVNVIPKGGGAPLVFPCVQDCNKHEGL
jgi:hypothetical protein